jgi:hypothetical protein
MRKLVFVAGGVFIFTVIFSFYLIPSSYAQGDIEKKFMKEHQEEMTTFMDKCSGCHSLQRVFAKKRSRDEWAKILKQMTGMPHAMISQEELKKIQKWIDLMQSSLIPGP